MDRWVDVRSYYRLCAFEFCGRVEMIKWFADLSVWNNVYDRNALKLLQDNGMAAVVLRHPKVILKTVGLIGTFLYWKT